MNVLFEPVNLLELALQNAAADPASRPLFYRELLDSKVLIVLSGEKPQIIDGIVQANSQIMIADFQFGGKSWVPFYTSEARLPSDDEYMLLDSKVLFEFTRGAPLYLNPGAPYCQEFLPEEVDRMLADPSSGERYVVQKSADVLIETPDEFPDELAASLGRLYSRDNLVRRAWLAFYYNPERDVEGGLLIALDIQGQTDWARISKDTGIVVDSMTRKHRFVDLVRYEETGITAYFSNQQPFYQRSALKKLWSTFRVCVRQGAFLTGRNGDVS